MMIALPLIKPVFISLLWLGPWNMGSITTGNGPIFPVAKPDVAVAAMAPGQTPGHPALKQGVLLIAGKNLLDPFFERAVVLITEYGASGTTGLVLNRRVKLSPGHDLPQLGDVTRHLDAVYLGGPVATNNLRLLVKSDKGPQGARMVVDNIFMIDTMETLRQLDPENIHNENVRMYMGFAGWAPGQLEIELLRGDWYIWPASSTIIFSKIPENIWYELISLVTATWT